MSRHLRRAILVLAAVLAASPAVADERDRSGEQAFLAKHADDMARLRVSLRTLSEPSLEEYVASVGRRLAPAGGLVFYVALDPQPNAFALPDGTIVVHTGLLGLMQNEAQLAAVLGHEIAHVSESHGYRSYRAAQRAKLAGRGLSVAAAILTRGRSPVAAILAAAGAGVATTAAVNGHARDLENDADRLGLQYAVAAGYDPREALALWRIMSEHVRERGAVDTWFFGRHDTIRARMANLDREIREHHASAVEAGSLVRNEEAWRVAQLRHTAMVEVRGGHHAAAAAAFRKLLEVAPNDARAHLYLGNVLRADAAAGVRVDDAVSAYERARTLDPGVAAAVDRELGAYWLGLGEYARAATHLEASLTRAPEDPEAPTTRERLRTSRALSGQVPPTATPVPTPPPPPSVPVAELAGRLRAPGSSERIQAAIALGNATVDDSSAPLVAGALALALEDESTTVRQQAAMALARLGARGRLAVPALIAALSGPNEFVDRFAAHALGEIGDPAALTALRAARAAEEEATRRAVEQAIVRLESQSPR